MPHSPEARALEGFDPDEAIAHLAAIVESSDDAIISKSLTGTIQSWNTGAFRIYGYTAAEMIGHTSTPLIPEDRAGEENEILARIARGERVEHFETTRRRKTGEIVHISLTISPIVDRSGKVIGASHVARDITERKRLDGQVGHLTAIVQSSEDAIVSKTLDGTILTWNRGAERLYGYSAAEALGQPMMLIIPPDRAAEESAILDRVRRGEEIRHLETIRVTKSGERIDVSLTIAPIRDASNRIIGASHVARNITERRRLEQHSEHLAAIVESAEDAIISKTLEGTILTWNRGAERVYGYTAAEIIGQQMALLLPEDRADEEAEILQRIRRGERVEHFETVRRKKTVNVSTSR